MPCILFPPNSQQGGFILSRKRTGSVREHVHIAEALHFSSRFVTPEIIEIYYLIDLSYAQAQIVFALESLPCTGSL